MLTVQFLKNIMNYTMTFLSREKNKLKAIYEDDLIGYLKSVGLYDDIVAGKHKCKYCGHSITLENLEIIVPQNDGAEFVCSNKNCLNQQ